MKLKNPKLNYLQFSSYPYYLGEKHADWVKPQEIVSFFKSAKDVHETDILSYQNFVESLRENPEDILGKLILEQDTA